MKEDPSSGVFLVIALWRLYESRDFDCHYGEIVVTDNDMGVIDEAFHLLEAYTEGPYEILEKNIDRVPEEYRPTALYLLNPDNW